MIRVLVAKLLVVTLPAAVAFSISSVAPAGAQTYVVIADASDTINQVCKTADSVNKTVKVLGGLFGHPKPAPSDDADKSACSDSSNSKDDSSGKNGDKSGDKSGAKSDDKGDKGDKSADKDDKDKGDKDKGDKTADKDKGSSKGSFLDKFTKSSTGSKLTGAVKSGKLKSATGAAKDKDKKKS